MKTFLIVPITLIFLFCGCDGCNTKTDEIEVEISDVEKVNQLISAYISSNLAESDTSKNFTRGLDTLPRISFLKQVYTKNNYKAFWTDKGKLNPAGQSLFSVIKDAHSFGLIPEDYHFTALDTLVEAISDTTQKAFSITNLGNVDLMLTDAFFTIAVHVSVGRIENDKSLVRTWKIKKFKNDLIVLFENAIKNKNFQASFEELEPQRQEYQAVKKYMNDYRSKNDGQVWKHLPSIKTDSIGFFAGIKTRLIQTGDYDSTAKKNDSLKLASALIKFQKRYFLNEDGRIGKSTIPILDMTPEDWLIQMEMNLERWRWEPDKFENRHMIVNLPAFKITIFEMDTIVMTSKIVCGAVKTQTPELDSKIYQIVLYPNWNVPYSIASKEILPKIKRDTSYLRKHRYDVLNNENEIVDIKKINWNKYNAQNLPYKFRQQTGIDNSLGIIKFEFFNNFNVYIHDTNAKKYFKFTTRAFSHGCIRLDKYMDLAHFLLRDDSIKIPRDTFDLWSVTHQQRKIDLKKILPIHVRYFTCDVDTNGAVALHADIYSRDNRMRNVIYINPTKKYIINPQPTTPPNKIPQTKKISFSLREDKLNDICFGIYSLSEHIG